MTAHGALAFEGVCYHDQIVDFDFEDRTYQIDPDRRKVYRRFVEIETSKASEIISTWRAEQL